LNMAANLLYYAQYPILLIRFAIVKEIEYTALWNASPRKVRDFYRKTITKTGCHLELGCGVDFSDFVCRETRNVKYSLEDNDTECKSDPFRNFGLKFETLVSKKFTDAEIIKTDLQDDVIYTGSRQFDSIGCKQVLHWIDCGFQKKVDHIVNSLRKSNSLKSNTVFFGTTAVSDTMDTGFLPRWSGRRLGESMNPKGENMPFLQDDRIDTLQAVLEKHFSSVKIEREGCLALYRAEGLKTVTRAKSASNSAKRSSNTAFGSKTGRKRAN